MINILFYANNTWVKYHATVSEAYSDTVYRLLFKVAWKEARITRLKEAIEHDYVPYTIVVAD